MPTILDLHELICWCPVCKGETDPKKLCPVCRKIETMIEKEKPRAPANA